MTTLSAEFIKAREDFAAWYDAKDEDSQNLIDEISDRTYFIIDEDEYDTFIDLLKDEGITTAEDFEDRFQGEHEGVGDHIGAEIAEELTEECGYLAGVPNFIANHVDWRSVWDCELRYDYVVLEYKGNTYIFHQG